MLAEPLSRKRHAALVSALLALAALLAGCLNPEETGDGDGDGDGDTGPKWDQRLTMTNVTDGAWLNLTITDHTGDTLTNFTVKIIDPNGTEVASVDGDFEANEGSFNATWGIATPQASEHFDVIEGRWTYEVWADGRVTVLTNYVPIEDGVVVA